MKAPIKYHFILPSDLLVIFSGRREKTWCYELYNDIKLRYGLTDKAQFPTVEQLSAYLNLPIEHIAARLDLK